MRTLHGGLHATRRDALRKVAAGAPQRGEREACRGANGLSSESPSNAYIRCDCLVGADNDVLTVAQLIPPY